MAVTQFYEPPIQPGVVRNFIGNFSANLDTAETIESATVAAEPAVLGGEGLTPVGSPVIGRVDARGRNFVADLAGPCVLQVFRSGNAIGDYTITFQATTNAGQTPAATFGVAIAIRS